MSTAALAWPVSPVQRVIRRSKPPPAANPPLNPAASRSTIMSLAEEKSRPHQKLVHDAVLKQATLTKKHLEINNPDMEQKPLDIKLPESLSSVNEAYDHCHELCRKTSRTYYLGSMLLTPERQRAVWAIYGWGTRIDQLVDGPEPLQIKSMAIDDLEKRLEDIYRGRPLDTFDAALSDTVSKFPIDIQLWKDLIRGMKMDLEKTTYKNFDELYLYCYLVAGTGALMGLPVMGVVPDSVPEMESIYNGVLALSIGNQLANILRDVGEDAQTRGRIYLPKDELVEAGISEADIFAGKVTDKWRDFMKKQIKRARKFYDDGEKCVMHLNSGSRVAVWVSLILSRQLLKEIEANDYNNLTEVVSVSMPKKICALALAYVKSHIPHFLVI